MAEQKPRIITYDYSDVPTIRAFIEDRSFIKAIKGPYGSGKSSGCVMALFSIACEQQPDTNGVRKTRFAIVRNSYRQLTDTTKKTIEEWLPFAKWKESTYTFTIDIKLEDGTTVYSEWLLRALDRPDQVQNLLSLEVTGAWLNEARELPKEIFDNIPARVSRFPKLILDENNEIVYGPTWAGVILDTNPPDTDHWFYKFFETLKYPNVDYRCVCNNVYNLSEAKGICPECKTKYKTIFHQPSALSPEAENKKHLARNYYENLMIGKDDEWIKVYIHGEYGYVKDGKAVFPNFIVSKHVSKEPLKPIPSLPIVIGMDMGLMPAAVFTQVDPKGRVYVYDELYGEFMSAKEFASTLLKPLLRTKYLFYEHIIIGDPAGSSRSQVDSRTVYQELRAQGLTARAAKTNALQPRLGAVNAFLTRMVEGKPAFLMDPSCNLLRTALNGAYRFRRMKLSEERYTDVPDKNQYSHIADALQYACLEHETGFFAYHDRPLTEKYTQPKPPISTAAWT